MRAALLRLVARVRAHRHRKSCLSLSLETVSSLSPPSLSPWRVLGRDVTRKGKSGIGIQRGSNLIGELYSIALSRRQSNIRMSGIGSPSLGEDTDARYPRPTVEGLSLAVRQVKVCVWDEKLRMTSSSVMLNVRVRLESGSRSILARVRRTGVRFDLGDGDLLPFVDGE